MTLQQLLGFGAGVAGLAFTAWYWRHPMPRLVQVATMFSLALCAFQFARM
jgi:hypothetical protein